MVVVVDSEDRENEGDLVIAGQFATPDAVNFMVTHARGLVCLALTEDRCEQLGANLIAERHHEWVDPFRGQTAQFVSSNDTILATGLK